MTDVARRFAAILVLGPALGRELQCGEGGYLGPRQERQGVTAARRECQALTQALTTSCRDRDVREVRND